MRPSSSGHHETEPAKRSAFLSGPASRPPPARASSSGLIEIEQLKRTLDHANFDLAAMTAQRDTLRQLVGERAERVRQLEAELAQRTDLLRRTKAELAQRDEAAKRFETEAATRADAVRRLETELEDRNGRLQHLEAERAERSATLTRLEGELSEHAEAIRRLEALRAEQNEARTRLEAEIAERADTAKQLDAALTVRAETMRRLATDLAERAETANRLEAALATREETMRRLEAQIAELRAQPPAEGDDLKRIKGIGPAFEKALKGLGICHYAQIAAWTEAEVEQVAAQLRIRPSRIHRESWVSGAAALAGTASTPAP